MRFTLSRRRPAEQTEQSPPPVWSQADRANGSRTCPSSPEEQVALVQRAVKDLQLIRRLVSQLPRLPVGDRQELVRNLDAASESLRTLYFLDTIY